MKQENNHYILCGGGTGGHIYPAIAIAEELLTYPETSVHFVGALGKMEMEKVPKAGYTITGMPIRGLQRGKILENVKLPFQLASSLIKSYRLLKKQKPKAIIGTGGYASAPIAIVASFLKIPVFLQEQNSFPGLVNRKISKYAKCVFTAYPNMERFFPGTKVIETGNPLRQSLINQLKTNTQNSKSSNKTVLILGGSLGARSINTFFKDHIPNMINQENTNWIWQCGKLYLQDCKSELSKHNSNTIELHDFIYNMSEVYNQADIVICRAGALTVSEIALLNKPTIFIPSPNVTDNHQYKNAKVLADQLACELIEEKDLDHQFDSIINVLNDTEKLNNLKEHLKPFSKPKASQSIVNQIHSVL